MKNTLKIIGYISIIPLILGLFFFSNIKGYYRFKELCGQEKRLVVRSKLERDVGWQLNLAERTSRDYALQIAGLPHVKFVRFQDDDRKVYDVYYVGKAPKIADGGVSSQDDWRDNFELQPANFDKPAIYQWQSFEEDLPNEIRMSRAGYRFTDLRTKQVVVSFTQLGYSKFDRNHTLFDAPSGEVCGEAGRIWEQQIQSIIFAQ
jgi:hypothetical protein